MSKARLEQDTIWKLAIESYFRPFVAFFHPKLEEGVDWERGFEFLDKELQRLRPFGRRGRRTADSLVWVYEFPSAAAPDPMGPGPAAAVVPDLPGDAQSQPEQLPLWLYVHIEVQGYREVTFEQRMFIMHYRLFDRYLVSQFQQLHKRKKASPLSPLSVQAPVPPYQVAVREPKPKQVTPLLEDPIVSLAIITEASLGYRPDHYESGRYDNRTNFQFPAIKLMDYNNEEKLAELENDPNPFALLTLAQVKALAERRANGATRLVSKLSLVRSLYKRGYSREEIERLFEFIDIIYSLPDTEEPLFREAVKQYEEEEPKMRIVTSIERISRKEGQLDLIMIMVEQRFGTQASAEVESRLTALTSSQLEGLARALFNFKDFSELQGWLAAQSV